MIRYHDEEWGVPLHDDIRHFEFITLDAFQAGLSWKTVLHKRENFRSAFHGFDPQRVRRMDEQDVQRLMQDKGIIRNRMKIMATISNAAAFCKVQESYGSFDAFIWQFTEGRTLRNQFARLSDLPSSSAASDAMSKALKLHGFRFVGTTICYAYMQAAGMVNDHLLDCFRREECLKLE